MMQLISSVTRKARTSRAALLALPLLGALASATAPTFAQTTPGVGYDPQGRGLSVSTYQLDTLTSPFRRYTMDFTADPGAVGNAPNPYFLNLSDAVVRAAYEQRYGPDTAGNRFKRFAGPGNEVASTLKDALVWWYQNRPEELGGSTEGRNGNPTEVEVIDVMATNDQSLWNAYLVAEIEGFSPERRVQINDPSKPEGDGQERHPFWKITWYYHNNFSAPPPFSPQAPPGVGR